MELEQIVMVVLILIIVYMLLQMSQQKKSQSDRVVYLQTPYIGRWFWSKDQCGEDQDPAGVDADGDVRFWF